MNFSAYSAQVRNIRSLIDNLSNALKECAEGKDNEAQAQIWRVRDEILILERKIEKIAPV